MAKQQDGYENMMSSIFDVLFAQAKAGKPPKPPRMTGLSGQSDMARALAEIASAPAMYLKDGAFEPFKNAIDYSESSFRVSFQLDSDIKKNRKLIEIKPKDPKIEIFFRFVNKG